MMTQENMLARYSVLHELGRGATGAVYAARDRQTGAVVALKRLDPALSGKPDASCAERFVKRARSARILKHRNIVEILDAGEAAGTLYVAMEMLEGESLRKILDDAPLPVARAIQIAHDIACALAYAHLEGVVHGCVKASNIIVLRSGVVKITDFGIGLGQSPEQLRGDPADHRCDLFSLGALLYEMLARRPPFAGGSAKEIMENMLHAKPPPPSELNPHVPRALDAIVLGLLAAQPAARMAGSPILIRDLQRLGEGLGLRSGASAGIGEPTASVPPAKPEARPRRLDPSRFREPAPTQDAPRSADPEAFDYQNAMALMERESRRERSSGSRPAIYAALALVGLAIGVAGFMYYSSRPKQWDIAVSRVQEAPAPMPPKPVAAEARPPAQVESVLARAPERPAPPPPAAAPAPEPARAVQSAAKVQEQQPGGTARLILAVSPQGELYIDGKHHGATPPITTIDLEPGIHRIEVRSGSRTPYLTYMTVQAGDVRRIRYDFDTSRAVHPSASASWRNSKRAAR